MRLTILIVITVLSVLMNLPSVYIGITGLFTFKKRKRHPKADHQLRFAVIIPARNEDKVIGNLIRTLRAQRYPADKIDIYAAINNTTDHTEAAALEAGAKILHAVGEIRNKGDVLHQVFEQLLPMDYDAYAIFDADNVPDSGFFEAMNDALCDGERICKGRLKAGNAFQSWISGGYGLYHALMEWTFSRPHTTIGCSSNLVGTAFVIHREVLEAMGGWNTVTICEDTEFDARAAAIGYRTAFEYDAMSYDEQVAAFGTSLRQRRRWCYGMVQSARLMTRTMFSKRCPDRRLARDFGMLFLSSICCPLSMLIMVLSLPVQPLITFYMMPVSLGLSYIGMMLAAILMCRLGGYPVKKMKRAIVMFPIFMASFIPLQLLALFVPVRSWSAIEHNGQADIGEKL